jgi:uncharacterized protein (TIGR03067 family)
MRCRFAVIILAGLLLAADNPSDQAVKDELAKLKGTWTIETVERNGMKMNAISSQVVIADDKYTQKASGDAIEDGTLKLDPSKKPPTIDLIIMSGADKGKKQVGVYELKDDVLRLCLALPGAEQRPMEIDGKKFIVFTLKKEKAKEN